MEDMLLHEGLVLPRQVLMERPQAPAVLQEGLLGFNQLFQQIIQLLQLPVLGLLLVLGGRLHLREGKGDDASPGAGPGSHRLCIPAPHKQ